MNIIGYLYQAGRWATLPALRNRITGTVKVYFHTQGWYAIRGPEKIYFKPTKKEKSYGQQKQQW